MRFYFPALLLAFVCIPSLAQVKMPSRLISHCERLLVDKGLLRPPTRARIEPIDGQVTSVGSVIAVQLEEGNNPVRYARTQRDVEDLVHIDPHFPRRFFKLEDLLGKKILDLACGEGRMVEQLLRLGVDIVGLDIHLTPYMLSKPYFVKASAHKTGLPSQSFDIIFTAQGPFKYLSHQPEMMQALMLEAHRLLKTGGVLRISPMWDVKGDFKKNGANPAVDLQGTIYTNLPPGMRLKSWPNSDWFWYADPEEGTWEANYWLELERID